MIPRSPLSMIAILSLIFSGCAHRSVDRTIGEEESSAKDTGSLQGSAWRLEDLGGAGVIDNVEATLEFPEAGKIVGRGSCNRFFGTVVISGQSIKIGPIGATKMACAEALMNQESAYFEALEQAERFAIDGSALLIYCTGMEKPLRFMRMFKR